MGCLSSKPNVEPSVPVQEKPQPSQQTSIPVRTTTTPPPGPGTTNGGRVRSRSQGAASSQRRQDNDRQEITSHQISSREAASMQRTRSVSMDVTALKGAPSHPSARRNRTASSAVQGSGHQRVAAKSLSAASSQTAAGRQGGRSRFPFALQSLLPNDFRFRILVVGKRECGKSSLIRTIFKADMSRSPINLSGRSDEFRPPNNRHLIVHECSASGPGEMQTIRNFITSRNHKSRPDSERLHAIWICIPISDVIHGQVDEEGVRMLLDTGVPLVIAFTKFDLASSSRDGYEERCRSLFGKVPAEIVSTQLKFRDLINKLVAKTDGLIIAHSRNTPSASEAQRTHPRSSPASLAWSVAQRASRDINVQAAIEVGRSRYWRRLWSSDDFVGQPLANCVEIIHADIVGSWNIPDKDKYFSNSAFKAEISYLVQDLTGSPANASSRYRSDGTPRTGAAWLNGRYENSNENICLVMGYIVDLIVILCRVFGPHGDVSPSEAPSVINSFAGSSHKTNIHSDISSFIRTVPQFQYYDNDVVMAKIIDLISRNCDPPSGNGTYK